MNKIIKKCNWQQYGLKYRTNNPHKHQSVKTKTSIPQFAWKLNHNSKKVKQSRYNEWQILQRFRGNLKLLKIKKED